jgi:membrane-bound ClpP family serine protease
MPSHRLWILLAFLVAVACGGPVARVDLTGRPAAQDAQQPPRVLMLTLTGKLGTTEIARCHRTLREAEALACSHVVFLLATAGSQGESPSDVQSLLDAVQRSVVPTVAVLDGRVTQGAAALALVCRRAYCLRSASWGEIEKPEQEWDELLGEAPDAAMAARLDALRAAMASRLLAREPRLRADAEKLALAMVDPRQQMIVATVRQGGIEREQVFEKAELGALLAGGAKVLGDRPLTRPLVLSAQEAEDFGLSNGTLQDKTQLAEVLVVDAGTIGELRPNWAEDMVGWLELLQPFLLVAGFLLLLVEVKTPGVGLPGLLGVAFLGLAFFYSHLVGLAELTEILLFFLGLAAIGVEIFLLPGTIVFGAVGFLCLVLALVLSRQTFLMPSNAVEEGILLTNLMDLTLLFVAVLVLGAVVWRLLPRVPWLKAVFLPPPRDPATAAAGGPSGLGIVDASAMALVGRVGTAATVLRPTGAMEVDGQRIDVVTEGEFVEAGTRIRVLYVQGPRIVVAAEAEGARSGERGSVGIVVLLCVVGLALLVAEVLFVSFGMIAVLAGVSLLSAIFVAFQQSIAFGVTMVAVEAIAAPLVLTFAFRLLPKTPFGKALILAGPARPVADASLRALVGKTGVSLSPLRPAGFARIDGQRFDVVTRGEMLDADSTLVVVDVSGNHVVVARAEPTKPSR